MTLTDLEPTFMAFDPVGGINPFEAPLAGIGEQALYRDVFDSDAELIRREHFGREANMKSLGHLYYFGAGMGVIFVVIAALMASGVMPIDHPGARGADPTLQRMIMAFSACFYLIVAVLFGSVGFGLTHLQVWARWMAVTILAIGVLVVAVVSVVLLMLNPALGLGSLIIGEGVQGLILYLLISGKTGMVFSPEYQEVIRKTPEVKHRTSILVKILLGVLLALVGLGVIGAIINTMNH